MRNATKFSGVRSTSRSAIGHTVISHFRLATWEPSGHKTPVPEPPEIGEPVGNFRGTPPPP